MIDLSNILLNKLMSQTCISSASPSPYLPPLSLPLTPSHLFLPSLSSPSPSPLTSSHFPLPPSPSPLIPFSLPLFSSLLSTCFFLPSLSSPSHFLLIPLHLPYHFVSHPSYTPLPTLSIPLTSFSPLSFPSSFYGTDAPPSARARPAPTERGLDALPHVNNTLHLVK